MLSKISLLGAIIFVALLFWGGSQPVAVGLFEPPFDKVAHFTAFGVLGFLLWLGFQGRWPLLIIILVGCVGALDEWRQAFLPGRAVSFGDFAMDMTAVVVVVGVMSARAKLLRGRRE
ncbi:MAG: VanZ family protein [Gammaproteobacteria bacterium]